MNLENMLKKTVLTYIVIGGMFTFLLISCNITGGGCGPSEDHFKVTGFETDLQKITSLDSTNISLSSINGDTISYRDLAVNMVPVTKLYSSYVVQKQQSFNLVSTAYACSPKIPTSEETITDIQIYSNKPFNDDYSSDEDLAEIFDVFVSYEGKSKLYELNTFLSGENTVPDVLTLLLTSAPSSTQSIQFTVKYFQNGEEMDEFNFTTNTITITQ